jgi:hypothetical protein
MEKFEQPIWRKAFKDINEQLSPKKESNPSIKNQILPSISDQMIIL